MLFLSMMKQRERGMTVIELMIGILITGLIVVAISLFYTRGIGSNRRTFEQVLITEEARTLIGRIGGVIRASHSINSDSPWLVSAGDNEIVVNSNIDADGDSEVVRYFLDGAELKRGITNSGEEESVQIIGRDLRNIQEGRPLFTYYSPAGQLLSASGVTAGTVKRVGIALWIDVNEVQEPGVAEVSTIVTPREALTGTSSRARLWPVALQLPSDTETGQLATVRLTNPDTGQTTEWSPSIVDLGDGALSTYDGHYYVNINYQSGTVGSFLPGWYAWIGPIEVGRSGNQSYTVTDQVPVNQLCLGKNIDQLVLDCEARTVSRGSFQATYKPIILHIWPKANGQTDYVRDITFGQ